MNIGFLVETPITREKKMYGAQRSLVVLVEELKRHNIKSFVVVSEYWEIVDKLKEKGADVLITPIYEFFTSVDGAYGEYHDKEVQERQNAASYVVIRKYFKENNIDIVHMNTRFCGLLGAKVAKDLGIPYIFHVREFLEADFGLVFKDQKYADEMISGSDAIIAISKSVFDYLKPQYPSTRIDTIYNGVSVEKYGCALTSRFNGNRIKFVIVGRVISHKGQFDAIRATESLFNKGFHNIELLIVGIRPDEMTDYEQMLVNYVKNNNLSDVVTFVPFTDDVENVLHACDVGLMCSRKEAFGRVTVEYMLASLLVIGANSGGTPEIITNGVDGILYTEGDYSSLADCMEWVLLHPEEANNLIRSGYAKALEQYTSAANADSIFNVYQSILNK